MAKRFALFLPMVLFFALAGCSMSPDVMKPSAAPTSPPPAAANGQKPDLLDQIGAEEELTIADPAEPFNRAMFKFNDDMYIYILEPVAKGYRDAIPVDFRMMFKNFFTNIGTPVRLVSSLLQGNGRKAGREIGSFFINSTMGILGFAAPAQEVYKIPLSDEDLGQVLGHYGMDHGMYIVWPFLGPSSARDTIGLVGDHYLDPITYLDTTTGAKIGIRVFEIVNATSFRIGDYQSMKGFALDPYVSMKNFYVQKRAKQVAE